mmetsp:Transcript_48669/g.139074  ORF Transcript_48669/g.139074 Transcript_48669/m.139074 type:complete len:496 (+) Transcript_48669:111-1598(+)
MAEAAAAENTPEAPGGSTAAADEDLASVGSKQHGELIEGQPACTPCAWFHKPAGCLNAKNCYYCHLCPSEELKNRKKWKVQRMKTKELEAKAGSAALLKRAKTADVHGEEASESPHLRRANTMPNSTNDDAQDGKPGGTVLLPGIGASQGQQPTLSDGSKMHGMLDANGLPACHPCAWFHKSNCKNDKDCIFCHLCPPGELKNRKKLKIQKLRGVDGTPTPGAATPSPAAKSTKSTKSVLRAHTDPGGRGGGSPHSIWTGSPFDAAGFMPPYGMFGVPSPGPWSHMGDPFFGYDPRLMMAGMPPPSPVDMSPRMAAMMSMASVASMQEGQTPVAGRLRDEPPGLSLPAEVPEGKITRVNWSVDIRKLGPSKKASSPAFQVPGASGSFRMALLPKGGASFLGAAMRGSVQVVREEISAALPGFVSMQVSVTRVSTDAPAEEKAPPLGPFHHDFAMSNVFELPSAYDDFDLEAIAGENMGVNICLEILPPDMAGVLQ